MAQIGFHYDKPRDILPGSLITVVKTGTCARKFELRQRAADGQKQDSIEPFFSEILEPGTAVIMTLEANLETQHGVPVVESCGSSGSVVFRTITKVVPWADMDKEVRKRKRCRSA